MKTLAEEKRHALIEVELTGGSLGRLLIQAGRLVSAHLGDADARGALARLRRNAGSARLQMLSLNDEQIALACAALAGTPVALGREVGVSFDSAAFVLQLGQQYFTGVVALEQGLQTYIRRFQYGTALSTERLPDKLRATRFTQIVWQEQLLPELGTSQGATASPRPEFVKPPGHAHPAAVPVVQAVPTPASHPATTPAPDPLPNLGPNSWPNPVADAPSSVQPQPVQPQPAQPQGAPRGFSGEVPRPSVETVAVQAAPTISAPPPSTPPPPTPTFGAPALLAPTFAAPVLVAPALSAPTPPAQAAPVQVVGVQAIQAPPASRQVEPIPATPLATARPSAAAPAAVADAEAWARLRAILDQNVGNRSPRVYQLMHKELGAFSGAELISRLAWQVERIAGATAARSFRDGR